MSGDETKAACKDAAQSLVMCMEKSSPCVQAGGKIMDCLKAKEIGDCESLRTAYYLCRRSQFDARTRIKGRKFADTG